MYRKERRTSSSGQKESIEKSVTFFLFSLFGLEAGRVLIETLSRPGNESCSMAPTPRPGLETNDIAFPTPAAIKWKSFVYFRKQTNCLVIETHYFEQFFPRQVQCNGRDEYDKIDGQ